MAGKPHEKRAMLLVMVLYNLHVHAEGCVKDWKVFADEHFSLLDGVCIEAFLLDLYLGRDRDPPVADCARCIEDYFGRRHHKSTLAIPKVQQTALLLGLYNRMLKNNRPNDAAAWA